MRIEKIKKLDQVSEILKKEFVGLDEIIDKIKQEITPWYITPEVITRPVIVSLWGMTGTGKTSVVRRLTELLELHSVLTFDCGEENNKSVAQTVTDKIFNKLSLDTCDSKVISNDTVFVFDEFQYARTIDENGHEKDTPNLRPIWNLLDSGILSVESNSWENGDLIGLTDDLDALLKKLGNIPLNGMKVEDRGLVEQVLNHMGFFWYNKRGFPGSYGKHSGESSPYSEILEEGEEISEETKDPFRPLDLIEERYLRYFFKRAQLWRQGGAEKFLQDINNCTCLFELVNLLIEIKDIILTPRFLDCTKSLVFVLGNLDEAFKIEGQLSPDMEADVFYDITSKVSISDIKNALKLRFRAEQIARFGNSIIKYPTLKEKHFREIIQKEASRIFDDFNKNTGIKVEITENIINLLYSEGVYPVQGVRPVFTTINSMLTSLFSEIIIKSESLNNKVVKLDVKDANLGYRFSEKTVIIAIGNDIFEKTIKLTLGELRDPRLRKNRYIASVHEAGHAIVMTYLTGKFPSLIVSVASNGNGGFCISYGADKSTEVHSKKDIMNSVKLGLGGYVAEHIVFKEDETRTLMGSGRDIDDVWDTLSEAIYNTGYFEPISLTNYESANGGKVPAGITDLTNLPWSHTNSTIQDRLLKEFKSLKTETETIIIDNMDLLVHVAEYLAEHGEMNGDVFKSFIERYAENNTLNPQRVQDALIENSEEWYKNVLNKFKKGN